jgi:hypothetical protein
MQVEPSNSENQKQQVQELRQLITRMLATGQRISDLSQEGDSGSMREIIELRRLLSDQLPRLVQITTNVIELTEGPHQAEMRRNFAALAGGFRMHLSRLQAEWPAVSIRQKPAEYRRARSELDEAQSRLFDWLDRALLSTLGSR